MPAELDHERFNCEVRAMSSIRPDRKPLLRETETWLGAVARALGFPAHTKDGFEIFSVRWDDDGSVHVHGFLPNENGKRHFIGEGADRRVATKWFECPVPPPEGLRKFAVPVKESP